MLLKNFLYSLEHCIDTRELVYVSGSSRIQTLRMSHDSGSIKTEVYNNGKTLKLLKYIFFIYKCVGI